MSDTATTAPTKGARQTGLSRYLDAAGRLRMRLECAPGQGKRAAYLASDLCRIVQPPTSAEPRHYRRKGILFTAWIDRKGVVWVRQETES